MSAISPLSKRLRPLYIAAFFQGFVLWYAIEKLFMKSIGLDQQAIALETILFTIVMLIANIPMGVLADRWSRKGVLIIASAALGICCLICGLSHNFWVYTLGISFWGIFYACYEGTYDSIVYDVLLEENGHTKDFEHYFGRIQLYDSAALVAGSLLCSVVVHFFSLRTTYFLTIPLAVASALALTFFKDSRIHKKTVPLSMAQHLGATLKAISQKGQVGWIVLCTILLSVDMRIIFEFDQFWIIAALVPATLFGPINAFVLTGYGLGGVLAKHIKNSHAAIILTAASMLISTFLMRFHSRIIIVLAIGILICSFTILSVLLSKYLHDALTSHVRSSASSVVSTAGYLAFLPVALLFGSVSKYHTVFTATWILISLAAAVTISLLIILKFRTSATRLSETSEPSI